MSTYCLIGTTPALARAELTAVFPQATFTELNERLLLSQELLDPTKIDRPGGLVKAGNVIQTTPQPEDMTDRTFAELCADVLHELQPTDKITFNVFSLEFREITTMQAIKKALRDKYQQSSRYLTNHMYGIEAAVFHDDDSIIELFAHANENKITWYKTSFAQDIDAWSARDRQKPYADRKKGMLPPKVARMMVNLALKSIETDTKPVIYDPFCGTGTVLMEAALLDCNCVGSDLDADAYLGTSENLNWLEETAGITFNRTVFKADVTHSNNDMQLAEKSIDAIVTEPFLGKPKPQPKKVPNIVKGLEKMYLGAFKQWKKVLKDGAVVVMVFPAIKTPKHEYTLHNLIDKLESFGYSTMSEPLEYSRPGAVVKRHIHQFRYQSK